MNNIRESIVKKQESELLNIKVELKSNQLSGKEREVYLKEKINSFETDYQIFISNWNKYVDQSQDKKAEINETITILQDEISSVDFNKKIERDRIANVAKQWNKDKKTNKDFITKLTRDNENLIKEKDIYIKNQHKWVQERKNDYLKSIDEIKQIITQEESNMSNIDKELLDTEKNIKDIDKKIYNGSKDLDQIKWGLRKSYGDLMKKRDNTHNIYQSLLIELNNIQLKYDSNLAEDPFKNEIAKISLFIEKNQSKIDKIKKQELSFIESVKIDQIDSKNKLLNLKLEIKTLTDDIESIELDYKNQEIKMNEEKMMRLNKIEKIKSDLKDHYKYMNDFKAQSIVLTNEVIEKYKSNFQNIDYKIKKNNDEIAKLKDESKKLFKNFDLSYKKYNQDIENEKKNLSSIEKRKNTINLERKSIEDSYTKYQANQRKFETYLIDNEYNINDIKLRTFEDIQEVNKIVNEAELELRNLEHRIYDLEKILGDKINPLTISELDFISMTEEQNKSIFFSEDIESESDIYQDVIEDFNTFLNNNNQVEKYILHGIDDSKSETMSQYNNLDNINIDDLDNIDDTYTENMTQIVVNLDDDNKIDTMSHLDFNHNLNNDYNPKNNLDLIIYRINDSKIDILNHSDIDFDDKTDVLTEMNFDLEDDTKTIISIPENDLNQDSKTDVLTEFNFDLEDDNKSIITINNNIISDINFDDNKTDILTEFNFDLEDD